MPMILPIEKSPCRWSKSSPARPRPTIPRAVAPCRDGANARFRNVISGGETCATNRGTASAAGWLEGRRPREKPRRPESERRERAFGLSSRRDAEARRREGAEGKIGFTEFDEVR